MEYYPENEPGYGTKKAADLSRVDQAMAELCGARRHLNDRLEELAARLLPVRIKRLPPAPTQHVPGQAMPDPTAPLCSPIVDQLTEETNNLRELSALVGRVLEDLEV